MIKHKTLLTAKQIGEVKASLHKASHTEVLEFAKNQIDLVEALSSIINKLIDRIEQ